MTGKRQRMEAWAKMRAENEALQAQVARLLQDNQELTHANRKLAKWIDAHMKQYHPIEQSPLGLLKPR